MKVKSVRGGTDIPVCGLDSGPVLKPPRQEHRQECLSHHAGLLSSDFTFNYTPEESFRFRMLDSERRQGVDGGRQQAEPATKNPWIVKLWVIIRREQKSRRIAV